MKKKKFIVSNKMQEVAVDIIEELIFCKNLDEVWEIVHKKCEKYNLQKDPFTYMPCTSKEFAESYEEYSRQCMEEKFGYYD